MASLRPVQVFGLSVPPGEEAVPALGPGEFPATFRITMAAIDPTITAEEYAKVNGTPAFTGSTLRLIRIPMDDDNSDEDDSEDEDFDLNEFLGEASSDDDEDEEEDDEEDGDSEGEEANGGPSDPSKSPKAKREAARQKFKEALAMDGHDMDVDEGPEAEKIDRLTAKQKGKAKALNVEDMDDSDSDDEDMSAQEPEEMVICTLDLSRNYQQPLDITINEHETVLFQTSGTHTVYLSGNLLIPEDLPATPNLFDPDDDDAADYDLSPDEDELESPLQDSESDDLDDLEDPRVEEVDSEDDDDGDKYIKPPKLLQVNAATQKSKNKRPHQDSDDEDEDDDDNKEAASLDDILNKSLKPADATADQPKVNGDVPLSKNQQKKLNKKLKANGGNAVQSSAGAPAEEDFGVPEVKKSQSPAGNAKSDKKVQFAKTLVQGPSSSASNSSAATKPDAKVKEEAKPESNRINGINGTESKPSKPTLGVKIVQGVTIDDKKLGSGPVAKKGDKVSMRYIGKLEKDKKVFDSNKKGKPFMFQLGASQVIKGWDIGVQGMAVGGERRITVPANLGYGNKAQGNDIPANSTLVFDVKMLNIS